MEIITTGLMGEGMSKRAEEVGVGGERMPGRVASDLSTSQAFQRLSGVAADVGGKSSGGLVCMNYGVGGASGTMGHGVAFDHEGSGGETMARGRRVKIVRQREGRDRDVGGDSEGRGLVRKRKEGADLEVDMSPMIKRACREEEDDGSTTTKTEVATADGGRREQQ